MFIRKNKAKPILKKLFGFRDYDKYFKIERRMKMEKNKDIFNVPTYIEKAIKKLFKLKQQGKELSMQIKDYMLTHDIPEDTPLHLLQNVPEEEVDPNQISFDI